MAYWRKRSIKIFIINVSPQIVKFLEKLLGLISGFVKKRLRLAFYLLNPFIIKSKIRFYVFWSYFVMSRNMSGSFRRVMQRLLRYQKVQGKIFGSNRLLNIFSDNSEIPSRYCLPEIVFYLRKLFIDKPICFSICISCIFLSWEDVCRADYLPLVIVYRYCRLPNKG